MCTPVHALFVSAPPRGTVLPSGFSVCLPTPYCWMRVPDHVGIQEGQSTHQDCRQLPWAPDVPQENQADQDSTEQQNRCDYDAEVGHGEICRHRKMCLWYIRHSPHRSFGYAQNAFSERSQVIPTGDGQVTALETSRFLEMSAFTSSLSNTLVLPQVAYTRWPINTKAG